MLKTVLRINISIPTNVLVIISVCASLATAQDSNLHASLNHAETSYWLGLHEAGNRAEFQKGIEIVDEALSTIGDTSKLPEDERALFNALGACKSDLELQIDMTQGTFNGAFPVVLSIMSPFVGTGEANDHQTLVDDPDVTAVSLACEEVMRKLSNLSRVPQYDVFFSSSPSNHALENEALYIFNGNSKFYVHPRSDLQSVLASEEIKQIDAGFISLETATLLRKAWANQYIIHCRIIEIDIFDGKYFYIVELKSVMDPASGNGIKYESMGFARDQRGYHWPSILIQCGLLLLSIMFYRIVDSYDEESRDLELIGVFSIPTVLFLYGRLFPQLVLSMISQYSPPPEALFVESAWWGIVVAVVLFIIPLASFRLLLVARLKPILDKFHNPSNTSILLVIIMAGALSSVITPMLFHMGNQLYFLMPLLLIILGYGGYGLGKAINTIDVDTPLWMAALYAAIILIIALSLFTGDAKVIYSLSFLTLLIYVPLARSMWRKPSTQDAGPVDDDQLTNYRATGQSPIESLLSLKKPTYHKFSHYLELKQRTSEFANGQTTWLGLTGKSGSGKTATVQKLTEELALEMPGKIKILMGACSEKLEGSSSVPYDPFRAALADHFNIDLLSPNSEGYHDQINGAVDFIFDTFVPFAGLLIPPGSSESSPSSNKSEIFQSIAKLLKSIASKQPIILFIDDVQWIDPSSTELIQFLQEQFQIEGHKRILFILASRDSNSLGPFELTDTDIIQIQSVNDADKLALMTSSLGFEDSTARSIIKHVSGEGGLHWLLYIIETLAREDELIDSEQGIRTKRGISEYESIIPDEIQSVVQATLNEYPEFRPIVECGACIGLVFNASILGTALGLSRLELLSLLDQIEHKTSIIYDVRDRDDYFSFRSGFLLNAIRQELNIKALGPRSSIVPQIVREYHARIANALVQRLRTTSNAAVYDVANHFYAAGNLYANEGLKYCLKGVDSAAVQFLSTEVAKYLEMALECAEIVHKVHEIEEAKLLLEYNDIHVKGDPGASQHIADQYASIEQLSLPLMVAVTRACYDGRHDQAKLATFAQILIDKSEEDSIHRAEGYHFLALGLDPAQYGKAGNPSEGEATQSFEEHKLELLKNALTITSRICSSDSEDIFESWQLMARVHNSLGETLSYIPGKALEAEHHYFERLRINSEQKLDNKQGQAMTHGGLGRLYLSRAGTEEDPDEKMKQIVKSQEHFSKDLTLAVEIGDIGGQVMCHSMIGRCNIELGEFREGLSHYSQSLELTNNPVGALFALAGILTCLKGLGEKTSGVKDAFLKLDQSLSEFKGGKHDAISDARQSVELFTEFTEEIWYKRTLESIGFIEGRS